MLDLLAQIGSSDAFSLDAAASATVLGIVAFLTLFAAALAERIFRNQSHGVFAGLATVLLLATIFLLGTIGHALLGWIWVRKLFSGELFFYLFCVALSALWLAAVISPARLAEPPRARRLFFRWQVSVLGSLVIILASGAVEGYNIFHFALNEAVRQIFAGIAAGIFVIAGGTAIYRLWRERAALWLWLALAALVFAGSVALFYFAPELPLLGYAAFGWAAVLVIIALFADYARFLRLESELRSGLLNNALKLEEESRGLAAILEFTREAVVHLDRDERVIYANPHFLQLANINATGPDGATPPVSEIEGKKLSSLLPRELYDKLAPAVQEARRGRSSQIEICHYSAGQEKLLQVYSAPLQDKYEKISGAHLGLLDLTARHQAKRSLEEAVAQKTQDLRIYQQGLENAAEAVVIADAENRILYVNEAFERITGFTRNEVVGRDAPSCCGEIEPARAAEILRRLSQLKSWRGEVNGRRKDGSTFINDLSVVPVEDAGGKIIRCLWIARDVTPHKDLERKLRHLAEALEAKSTELARAKQDCESLQQRNNELQRRIDQLTKVREIGEDIRLNVGLDSIMQSLSDAVAALGWQRVLIFQRCENDLFERVASTGFANPSAPSFRQLRQVPYSEFAPYLLERFRMSQSFFIDSGKLAGDFPLVVKLKKAGAFTPSQQDIFKIKKGDWLAEDALLVPIRVRDQLVGLIAAFCPSDGHRPDLQRVRDLEIVADNAANAIANSRSLALHQRNERQARTLADIGKIFRAAGTVEQVVTDIAGISAQGLELPCLIVVRQNPASLFQKSQKENRDWLGALGTIPNARDKSGRTQSRLLEASELPETFLARLETAGENDVTAIEISCDELPRLVLDEIIKIKSKDSNSEWQLPLATCHLLIAPLRSRGQCIGYMAYPFPAGVSAPELSHRGTETFVNEIADRAALTIENARLFHEAEEKALALERANQLISDFLASVSHELRTPMHSILQFSELVLSRTTGKLNSEQQRQIEIIQRSGKNLLALLNDILDLSKIQAGKMEATLEKFDLAQAIQEAIDSIQSLCEQKQLALRIRMDEELPVEFCSDRSLLLRVLTNLLGNAVKFTERGEIHVWARMRRNSLVVSVQDTGIGIPAARQKHIFEPFRQLESSEARRHGGTGLGLAISRKMLAILNGNIEVESEPGKGSKFTIYLPESTLPPGACTPGSRSRRKTPRAPRKRRKEKIKEIPSQKAKPAIHFPAVPGLKMFTRAKTPRILVVEDDENTRYAMQFILANAGYRVDFAEGGEKALLAAQRQRPDLILMDIMMPNVDGYQVARMLKAQKQLAHIPVVALTARAMKGDREKALAAGCNDYLTKPFESKDILAVLEKWLRK